MMAPIWTPRRFYVAFVRNKDTVGSILTLDCIKITSLNNSMMLWRSATNHNSFYWQHRCVILVKICFKGFIHLFVIRLFIDSQSSTSTWNKCPRFLFIGICSSTNGSNSGKSTSDSIHGKRQIREHRQQIRAPSTIRPSSKVMFYIM